MLVVKVTKVCLIVQSLSMLVLSLALSWSALAPYSGTLAVLGTVA